MSNEKRNPSNSATAMLFGVLLTDVRVDKTANGKKYARFMMSGENGFNYWVSSFNERVIESLEKNIGKQSVVSVVGEISGINKGNGEYKPTLSVNAKNIDFVSNFGQNRKVEEKAAPEQWGANKNQQQQSAPQQQQQQQQQQSAPQQPMQQGNAQPMDFDDDIPF